MRQGGNKHSPKEETSEHSISAFALRLCFVPDGLLELVLVNPVGVGAGVVGGSGQVVLGEFSVPWCGA